MDASNPTNAPSETYAIAPTGDTILVVGDRKTELRVHYLCMRTASKVFDPMFGPHFSEGRPSNGDLPKEIPMPDDNATAMTTICNVIHHRNALLPDVLEPSKLAEIAEAADKYDCVLALKYVMIQWLDHQLLDFKTSVFFLNVGSLLMAAYVFDNSGAFRRVTQKLISGTSHSYYGLIKQECDGIVPSSIYYSLERARTRTRVSVQDVLLTTMALCCDYASERTYDYMQDLLDNDLWGVELFKVSVDSAIEKARRLVLPTSHCEDEMFRQGIHNEQQTNEARYSKLKELRESAGLCLSCVRSGNIDANLPCNLDH